jgi:hypothetical protein
MTAGSGDEPADAETNLMNALRLLDRLSGVATDEPSDAGEGTCPDCREHHRLTRFGRMTLCRRCARLRRRAGRRS